MTEPSDDRAERAFRAALAREADGYQAVALDPIEGRPRRSWWRPALVAAAVLVLVGGTALAVSLRGSKQSPTSGTPAASITAPEEGWRYESFLDVVVQVPDSWGYAAAPGADWCAFDQTGSDYTFPTQPFVDTTNPYGGVLGIGCIDPAGSDQFGAVPERLWATHLSFAAADDARGGAPPDGTVHEGDWTTIVATVGAARLSVLADPAHLDEARRILDSAEVVDTDQSGCDASSPIQQGDFVRPDPAFDVGELDSVDSIAVCQYDLNRPVSKPGLLASRLLTGDAAAGELSAIQAASPGGGPDTPDSCMHGMDGDTAVVLRLTSGQASYDLYVYYEWCFGNGFDDGTTRHELTKDSCAPLFADRVRYMGGSSAPFSRCHV